MPIINTTDLKRQLKEQNMRSTVKFPEELEMHVWEIIERAKMRALMNKRKTLFGRDLEENES